MKRENDIKQLVNQAIEGTDIFLVELKLTQNRISIFIDKMSGVTIEECVRLHKYLVSELREDPIFESHNFEVSSPGMDQPLKVLQQYKKRVGSVLDIITTDGLHHSGMLVDANEDGIELNEKVNKEEKKEHYLFKDIKQATISF